VNDLSNGTVRLLRPEEEAGPVALFCGHCGRAPEDDKALLGGPRVCSRCNLGLLLEAGVDVAPAPGDPFLVVDAGLRICAVSQGAERMLATSETEAVNCSVLDLMLPDDGAMPTDANLPSAITRAARGDGQPRLVTVRLSRTPDERHEVVVAACGPPPAALLVLRS
jgi:PAS domain-containing protein